MGKELDFGRIVGLKKVFSVIFSLDYIGFLEIVNAL